MGHGTQRVYLSLPPHPPDAEMEALSHRAPAQPPHAGSPAPLRTSLRHCLDSRSRGAGTPSRVGSAPPPLPTHMGTGRLTSDTHGHMLPQALINTCAPWHLPQVCLCKCPAPLTFPRHPLDLTNIHSPYTSRKCLGHQTRNMWIHVFPSLLHSKVHTPG